MSAISGIVRMRGRALQHESLVRMSEALASRGPDHDGLWHEEGAGLGHRALWISPETEELRQPWTSESGSLRLVFDGRIDNIEELSRELTLSGFQPRYAGDAELVIKAYQCWGENCPARILGDFAFAVWDKANKTLFCARDVFGARPFYYHHQPGNLFVFASTPAALFASGIVQKRISEERIADFLTPGLEGIDKTSSFFKEVLLLPPAYSCRITPDGMVMRRYWTPDAAGETRFSTDHDYEEAFLDLFGKAVGASLRGGKNVGAMLSGGLDSSSIVGVARQLGLQSGSTPLNTYSVVNANIAGCIETRAIQAMLGMEGIRPTTLDHTGLDGILPDLSAKTWKLEDPHDYHMIVPRSLYILARRDGMRAVLDGIDGDSVLSEGKFLVRLLRKGKFIKAWREAAGHDYVYYANLPAHVEYMQALRATFVPEWVRRMLRPMRTREELKTVIDQTLMRPEFANRVNLSDRLETLNDTFRVRNPLDREADMRGIIEHTYITRGVERYERVAAACGIEARHPFLDRRLVEFAICLPDDQKIRHGWPKNILRCSMRGILPEDICWRRGKRHLSGYLTPVYVDKISNFINQVLEENQSLIGEYLRLDDFNKLAHNFKHGSNDDALWRIYEIVHLANWLNQQRDGG